MGVILAIMITISVTNGGGEDPISLKQYAFMPDVFGMIFFIFVVMMFVKRILSAKDRFYA